MIIGARHRQIYALPMPETPRNPQPSTRSPKHREACQTADRRKRSRLKLNDAARPVMEPEDGPSHRIAAAARLASDFLWSDLPPGPAAQELAAPSLPRFVTISALAMALGVNERTIRRGIQKGLIRTAPLGGRLVRIPAHEVDRLIAGEPLPAPGGRKEDQSVTDINDYS